MLFVRFGFVYRITGLKETDVGWRNFGTGSCIDLDLREAVEFWERSKVEFDPQAGVAIL